MLYTELAKYKHKSSSNMDCIKIVTVDQMKYNLINLTSYLIKISLASILDKFMYFFVIKKPLTTKKKGTASTITGPISTLNHEDGNIFKMWQCVVMTHIEKTVWQYLLKNYLLSN